MRKKVLYIISLWALFAQCILGLSPSFMVSRGQTVYTSKGENAYLTDGFLTNWKYSMANDMAFNIGVGPKKLFVTWESLGDCAWATDFTSNCSHQGTPFRNFRVLTSANSTNGQDGDWIEATAVEDNPVMARGIFFDFEGMAWFRFVSDGEIGELLEVQAFDATNHFDDSWFFMGTSISQMGLKQQETDSTTADIIHARFPQFSPAMLRGGIGCINSSEVVNHLNDYLRYAGNVRHWAIEMGTNDAWGGGDWNLETFKNNMQTIIDSAKANGIEPILARIIATNEAVAGWQVNSKYLDVVDELTEKNSLFPGPDFYNYFLAHPELIASDGVHPNAETRGGQAMHHLWAEALLPLYSRSADSVSMDSIATAVAKMETTIPGLAVNGHDIQIIHPNVSSVDILALSGKVVEQHLLTDNSNNVIHTNVPAGMYIVVVRWQQGCATYKTLLK